MGVCLSTTRVRAVEPNPGASAAKGGTAPPLRQDALVKADGRLRSSLQDGLVSRHDIFARDPHGLDDLEHAQAVAEWAVITAPPQPMFKDVNALMKTMYGVPHAAVLLVDERQNLVCPLGTNHKSGYVGSFWQWAFVPNAPKLLLVEDATLDSRFSGNPLVTFKPHIRFVAAAPLLAAHGRRCYGVLAVFDFEPRMLSTTQSEMLTHFAEVAVREMEREQVLQMQRIKLDSTKLIAPLTHLMGAMDSLPDCVVLLDLSRPGWTILYANAAFCAAVSMPELLAVGGMASNDSVHDPGSGTADFWDFFEEEQSEHGSRSSSGAISGLVSGGSFVLRVHPRAPRGNGSCAIDVLVSEEVSSRCSLERSRSSMGSDCTKRSCQVDPREHSYTVLFQPTSEQQQPGMLALPGMGAKVFVAVAGRETKNSTPPPAQQVELYYFGILQQVSAGNPKQQPWQPIQVQERQQHTAVQQSKPSAAAALVPPRAVQGRASESVPDSSCALSLPWGPTKSGNIPGSFGSIPWFYNQQPEVMKEVQLGPLIGAGAMGRCYRGLWQGGRVAVKIIDCWTGLPPCAADNSALAAAGAPSQRERQKLQSAGAQAAIVEALLGRSLSHPHIVSTYCHGATTPQVDSTGRMHQQVWIVQQYCNRGSLAEALKKGSLRTAQGGASLHTTLLAAQEIAGALHYLHSHDVIHGDLTPNNVLLNGSTKDARRWVCMVSDFGLARIGEEINGDTRTSVLGTVTHMPPEMLAEGTMSSKVDVWSFGVILLEMFEGKRAWHGYSIFQTMSAVTSGKLPFPIPSDAPPALASLLRRCLSNNPGQRPSFALILEEVQGMLKHLPRTGQPDTATNSPTKLQQAAEQARPYTRSILPNELNSTVQHTMVAPAPSAAEMLAKRLSKSDSASGTPCPMPPGRALAPRRISAIGINLREGNVPVSPFATAAVAQV